MAGEDLTQDTTAEQLIAICEVPALEAIIQEIRNSERPEEEKIDLYQRIQKRIDELNAGDPLDRRQERLDAMAKNKPEVWICTYCGHQHPGRSPFPNPCRCGNVLEDAYRLKEVVDYQDEAKGQPIADAGNEGWKHQPSLMGGEKGPAEAPEEKTSGEGQPAENNAPEGNPEEMAQTTAEATQTGTAVNEQPAEEGAEGAVQSADEVTDTKLKDGEAQEVDIDDKELLEDEKQE